MFVAVFAMVVVVVGMEGVIRLIGWQQRLTELICVLFTAGYPLDLVIRLSMEYKNSPLSTRNEKIQMAQGECGLSLLSGLIVSFCFCIPFHFAQLVSTTKFAMIMTTTVVSTFFITFIFFCSAIHIIGPEDGFCDIPFGKYYTNIKRFTCSTKLGRFPVVQFLTRLFAPFKAITIKPA
mgnify:CR=1 FL=1